VVFRSAERQRLLYRNRTVDFQLTVPMCLWANNHGPLVLLVTKSLIVHYAGIAVLFSVTGMDRASFAIN